MSAETHATRLDEMAREYRDTANRCILPSAARSYENDARSCEAGAAALRRGTCVWQQDEDGAWSTACGKRWEFTWYEHRPSAHDMRFCHHCGQTLGERGYVEPANDES